jgi:hypothetical protein
LHLAFTQLQQTGGFDQTDLLYQVEC